MNDVKKFFNQPVYDLITYENIRKLAIRQENDYTPNWLFATL